MKRNLKLYVWQGVLSDRTSGIAFALATSEDHARDLIMEKEYGKDWRTSTYIGVKYLRDDLKCNPEVCDSPVAFTLSGGGRSFWYDIHHSVDSDKCHIERFLRRFVFMSICDFLTKNA